MEKMPPSASVPQVATASATRGERHWLRSTMLGVIGLVAIGLGYYLLRGNATNGHADDSGDDPTSLKALLFRGWNKPDLAIVLSGQSKGFLQECGCSHPQKGGLARRFNLIQSLKDKGWPVVPVDLGEIAQKGGPQAMLKYETAMKALDLMGYKAIGLGEPELLMPLTEALAHSSLNNPNPRPLAANLKGLEKGNTFFDDYNVRPYEIVNAGTLKVGVVSVVGSRVSEPVEEALPAELGIKFLRNDKVLPGVLTKVGGDKTDFNVLLYQGLEREAKLAAKTLHEEHAKDPGVAGVHLVFCLTEFDEPPGALTRSQDFPNTSLVTIGHKGRYAGVVGVWRTPRGLELRYQLVPLGPEYESPAGKEKDNPVMALMETYAQRVKDGGFLSKYPRSKHPLIQADKRFKDAYYVGSEVCASCHKHATKVWKESAHSHAFDALVKAKNPRQREFDGECVKCHTIGFDYLKGYNDPQGAAANDMPLKEHNELLRHVGCESCHGPGSEHAAKSRNADLYPLINPYRASGEERDAKTTPERKQQLHEQRMKRIDIFCQDCHDSDNDVHWGKTSFEEKWIGRRIIHMTPKSKD
ncbi:MAG: hypothetical protein L0Y72_06045 [Gemmataceae bacterium]|nr:hypothetical protein [Gemmataceae bacterium]MCI0738587.1 hypothetical protein [Gemmataceae bacterium]